MGMNDSVVSFNETPNTGIYSVEASHYGNAIQFDSINDYAILGTGQLPTNLNYHRAYHGRQGQTPNLPGTPTFQFPLFFIGNFTRSGIEVYIQVELED